MLRSKKLEPLKINLRKMNTNVGKKKYKTGKYLTQNKLIER